MSELSILHDAAAARRHAEHQLEQARAVEGAHNLLALAKRLHAHADQFARQDLFLAFHTDHRYPAIYIVRRDHSRWCRVWWCAERFRLDATAVDPPGSCDWHDILCRDLTANTELAGTAILTLLDRRQLVLGNAYLPGDLHPLDQVTLLSPPPPSVPALPSPPVALPAAPTRLRAVPLRLSLAR